MKVVVIDAGKYDEYHTRNEYLMKIISIVNI